jgi:hypothetical protein
MLKKKQKIKSKELKQIERRFAKELARLLIDEYRSKKAREKNN